MVAIGRLSDRYRAIRRAAVVPGHPAWRTFASALCRDRRASVVDLRAHVARHGRFTPGGPAAVGRCRSETATRAPPFVVEREDLQMRVGSVDRCNKRLF